MTEYEDVERLTKQDIEKMDKILKKRGLEDCCPTLFIIFYSIMAPFTRIFL